MIADAQQALELPADFEQQRCMRDCKRANQCRLNTSPINWASLTNSSLPRSRYIARLFTACRQRPITRQPGRSTKDHHDRNRRNAPAIAGANGNLCSARSNTRNNLQRRGWNILGVIATSTPVLRRDYEGDYFEILSIEPKAIRLDRLQSGTAPVLDSHRSGSTRDQIGIVTDARSTPAD
ncbi:hypothetical protein FXV83_41875 [Bradyrhizobium hipponense]|uniref:Uncharacterized protein n=1 Tax=Bradyrhizobium hipponense TaxID=2605638 RepID=A0A5S4YC25_9BRAD|nr:hypothetical protein [Bradyrhizobium hipponense]TYO60795.1 hypothetical protein FXV83_41875 [Bradyrhizobium hipponense]